MTFAGLPLSTLLGVAGAAGGLVVVFYILKLRRRPVGVPFARLWKRVLRDKEATTLFSQLKRLLSLLLQLILLALLILALGDPKPAIDLAEGRNLVVLIDASASMKATDVQPSRMEVARGVVRQMAKGLGSADRMLVARLDASVTPLTTMTEDVAALGLAVEALSPSDTRADLRRGLRFALDSLRGLPQPEIVLVSDGAFGDLDTLTDGLEMDSVRMTFVPIGESGRNVAITGFSVRRYPLDKSRYEVMLEILNTNDEPADLELSLLGDGEVAELSRVTLGPKERLPRFYKDLGGASRTLEARIRFADGSKDDLPADDHAYALMPERKRSKVLLVTAGNTYLEAALLLDEYLVVNQIEPGQYPPPGSFDVTIFDGVAPAVAEGAGGVLYLNPPEKGAPVPVRKKIKSFGFDTWDRKSPVLRWIAMGDIQVAEGHAFKPERQDKVLGASDLGPILVGGVRSGRRFLALGFDPRDSDMVMRVAWPLFLMNTIDSFVSEDTRYVSSYRTGEVWNIPVPGGVETATLEDPSGRKLSVPVKENRAVYFGDQAGFFKLHVEGESEPLAFAANLIDPLESAIEPRKELEFGKKRAEALGDFEPHAKRDLWLYLLLAAMALSLIEWITYHRRVTV